MTLLTVITVHHDGAIANVAVLRKVLHQFWSGCGYRYATDKDFSGI